jgi:hypothetical protein
MQRFWPTPFALLDQPDKYDVVTALNNKVLDYSH